MPAAKKKLTWFRPNNLKRSGGYWIKTRNGKVVFRESATNKSEAEYQRCLALWLGKEKELSGAEHPLKAGYSQVIDQLAKMADYWSLAGRENLAQSITAKINSLQAELAGLTFDPLNQPPVEQVRASIAPALENPHPIDAAVWATRFETMDLLKNETPVVKELTIEQAIDQHLTEENSYVERGIRAVGSVYLNKINLNKLKTFCGSKPISTIGDQLQPFLSHLYSEKATQSVAANAMKYGKKFAKWCYTRQIINDLPRVLSDREALMVVLDHKEPNPFNDSEMFKLLAALENPAFKQLKLCILLMLNCGMYACDVGNLKHSNIDLKAGNLTYARWKNRKNGQVSGKATKQISVTYPLWSSTLTLLKELATDKGSEYLLVTEHGKPLWMETTTRSDAIGRMFTSLRTKENLPKEFMIKRLRKAGTTKLDSNIVHQRCSLKYGQWASDNVKNIHYSLIPQQDFNNAIDWLGTQWNMIGQA